MHTTENYMDQDVAYFLGLFQSRGVAHINNGMSKIEIIFPTKALTMEGMDQRTSTELGVATIRERVASFLDNIQVHHSVGQQQVTIHFDVPTNGMFFRNLKHITNGILDYRDSRITDNIYNSNDICKKEYIRGIADTCGFVRRSNADWGGNHRVYIELHHKNWKFPIDLCLLLQHHLDIPVQQILWGHPIIRGEKSWAKEHDLRVYNHNFVDIGFYIPHKNEILKKLAEENIQTKNKKKCWPEDKKRYIKKKRKSKESNSNDLHTDIRGKHFNHYSEICVALGCTQCYS